MSSARETVESYQTAIGSGDFTTARKLMQDDMTFQGPIDTFHQADDYLESLKRLASIIQRIDVKRVFAEGDDVCVLYEMVTNTPAGKWYLYGGAVCAAIGVVASFRYRPRRPRGNRWPEVRP